ncbi:hypothetical protein LCGC14_1485590 [marine sediment metagenome]|uniref:Uncharacterized protein n=1 Tax=marine sediment metagenome TaxID=412755 RepID=A0A0F9MA50_9ZZZZ
MDEPTTPKQICTIAVIFTPVSDDEGIEVKKKIGEAIKDLPDARVDFRITNMPQHGPPIR